MYSGDFITRCIFFYSYVSNQIQTDNGIKFTASYYSIHLMIYKNREQYLKRSNQISIVTLRYFISKEMRKKLIKIHRMDFHIL